MAGYTGLSEKELVWRENRELISLQARQILRRVLDVALTELDKEFNAALKNNQIVKITADEESLSRLLLSAAKKELGDGTQI